MAELLWCSPIMTHVYGLPEFEPEPPAEYVSLMEPNLDWTWCDEHYGAQSPKGSFIDLMACTRARHEDDVHIAGASDQFLLVWRV